MEKTDLRIEKTYTALKTAFTELLQKKKFEDITVNELCDKAIIRRATFYKHFADKFDFFSFYCNEFHREYMQSFSIKGTDEKESIYKLFDFLDQNRQLLLSLQESKLAPSLIDTLSSSMVITVKEMFYSSYKERLPKEIEPDLLIRILSGALISAVKWWLENERHIDKETFVQQLKLISSMMLIDPIKD